MMDQAIFNGPRQAGAVLAISLIMLLLLTIVGVSATQFTGLEERMAGNLRDRNLAFQAAETALRAGEAKTGSALPCAAAAGEVAGAVGGLGIVGFYAYTDAPIIDDVDGSVWSPWSTNKAYSYDGNLTSYADKPDDKEHKNAIDPPQYIIQCASSVENIYRITARGTGGTADAVVVLQTVYKPNP
jgi:type IV pilus assembly protein PilX